MSASGRATEPVLSLTQADDTVTASGKYRFGTRTDTGVVRELNEDTCLAEPQLGLWLVADGMGGHRTGDVASRIVRDTVLDRVSSGCGLSDAIRDAHKEILKEADAREGSQGMGTTVVAVLVAGPDYEVAWVGDSRAYLYDDELMQITSDHSYVQRLLQAGSIGPSEFENHPSRHLLTRCLGVNAQDSFEVETRRGRFSRGQEVLLCSDGLTDELSDAEIEDILRMPGTAQERVEKLVDAAIEHGGRDNVTVVLFSAPSDAPSLFGWARKLGMMALGAVLAAVVLGVVVYFRQLGVI